MSRPRDIRFLRPERHLIYRPAEQPFTLCARGVTVSEADHQKGPGASVVVGKGHLVGRQRVSARDCALRLRAAYQSWLSQAVSPFHRWRMKKAVKLSISSCWIACLYCDAVLRSAPASQSANRCQRCALSGALLPSYCAGIPGASVEVRGQESSAVRNAEDER